MMIAEKISLILILFVAFFVVSSGLFLILHIVFKNLQEKRNKDLLGKMPNYMTICACILAQIIAIGLMVFLILEIFEVGKNMPQNHLSNEQRQALFKEKAALESLLRQPQPDGINEEKQTSEFAYLNGSDSTKISDDQFWDQFKQKPQ